VLTQHVDMHLTPLLSAHFRGPLSAILAETDSRAASREEHHGVASQLYLYINIGSLEPAELKFLACVLIHGDDDDLGQLPSHER